MTAWLVEWKSHLAQFARDGIELTLLPPGCIISLMTAGLLSWHHRARLAHMLLWSASLLLLLLSMPIVAGHLTLLTGRFAPLETPTAARAQAIIVLAAEERDAPEYGGYSVGELTLERVRFGARLARASGLPVLLSGGRFAPDEPYGMAQLMQRVLSEEFGVVAIWLENDSRSTRESAERSASILRAAHIDTAVVVTHYAHMRRAVDNFVERGITVIAGPVGIPPRSYRSAVAAVWPHARALQDSSLALHELLALAGRYLGVMT